MFQLYLVVLVSLPIVSGAWRMQGHDAQHTSLSASSVLAGNGLTFLNQDLPKTNNPGALEMMPMPVVPPLLDDDGVLYAAFNGSLHALQATNGSPLWVYEAPSSHFVGAALCLDMVVGITSTGAIYAQEANSGAKRWAASLGPKATNIQHPICDESNLYIAGAGIAASLSLSDGSTNWQKTDSSIETAFALTGGKLYSGSTGSVVCLNATSGDHIWESKLSVAAKPMAPVLSGNLLFVGVGYGLTVLSALDGSTKCQATTSYLINGLPTVSASQLVYLSSLDNHIYGFGFDCSLKWNTTVYQATGLALDGNGGLYFTALDKAGTLNASTGKLIWSSPSPNILRGSTLSLDFGGSAFYLSNDARVVGLGLSTSTTMSQYHQAVRLALINCTSEAINILTPLCELREEVESLPSREETRQLNTAIMRVCQTANNLANGLDPYGHPVNYVHALPFSEYSNYLIQQQLPALAVLEQAEQNYSNAAGDLNKQIAAAKASHNAITTSEKLWQASLGKDEALLAGYSKSLASIKAQMTADLQATGPLFDQLLQSMESKIEQLQQAIKQLKADEIHEKHKAVTDALEGALLGFIPFIGGALRKAKMAQAAKDLVKATKDALNIVKDNETIKAIELEMKMVNQLQGYMKSLDLLNSQIEGNMTLPQLLPTIFIDEVDQARIKFQLNLLSKTLLNFTGGSQLEATIEDFVTLSQASINAIIAWYQVGMKKQHAEGALDLLKIRDALVQVSILRDMSQLAGIAQAKWLVNEHRRQQSLLGLQTAMDEKAQFRFWALKDLPYKMDTKWLDPHTEDFKEFDEAFSTAVINYQSELNANASEVMWTQYVYNASENPFEFALFHKTGRISVQVPLPFKDGNQTQLVTNFWNVRMMDVRIVAFPQSAFSGRDVNPSFRHAGASLIVDGEGVIHEFTHDASWNYGFRYDPSNLCPNTHVCTSADSADCPKNVNWTPFGRWELDFSQSAGIKDLSKITAINLQFKVTYVQGGPRSTPFFGRCSQQLQYPIPTDQFGSNCPNVKG